MSENRDTEHPLKDYFDIACCHGIKNAANALLYACTQLTAVRSLTTRYNLGYKPDKLEEVIEKIGEVFDLMSEVVELTPEEQKQVDLALRKLNAGNN